MTREQLLQKKKGLEVQRDNTIAQVNFTLGALALVDDLLKEMDAPVTTGTATQEETEHVAL